MIGVLRACGESVHLAYRLPDTISKASNPTLEIGASLAFVCLQQCRRLRLHGLHRLVVPLLLSRCLATLHFVVHLPGCERQRLALLGHLRLRSQIAHLPSPHPIDQGCGSSARLHFHSVPRDLCRCPRCQRRDQASQSVCEVLLVIVSAVPLQSDPLTLPEEALSLRYRVLHRRR